MLPSPCTTFWSSKLLYPHFHTYIFTTNSHGSKQHIFLKDPLLFNSKLKFSTKMSTGNVNTYYKFSSKKEKNKIKEKILFCPLAARAVQPVNSTISSIHVSPQHTDKLQHSTSGTEQPATNYLIYNP